MKHCGLDVTEMQGETGWGGELGELWGLGTNCENSGNTSGSPASEKHSVASHETHPVTSAVMVSTSPVARRSACVGKSDV